MTDTETTWYQNDIDEINWCTAVLVGMLESGMTYDAPEVNAMHNRRAKLINSIEEKSGYDLLVKVSNRGRGKCNVYNRQDYLENLDRYSEIS